jgi:cytochrome c-type biogenesis protein CcmH/NrfF
MNVWSLWITILAIISIIFWLMWRYTSKIEREAEEEKQWKEMLKNLWETDPQQAQYYQTIFDSKYK